MRRLKSIALARSRWWLNDGCRSHGIEIYLVVEVRQQWLSPQFFTIISQKRFLGKDKIKASCLAIFSLYVE
ncbi:hypothetical protein H6S82_07030 [Planktothrix sp. FACHB-1355]|uniref:Uncharacterized protein n=1 Tax=Aerosakkonema funiforme FACHB-1375 TaxID=2949571 RepID=A0A926VLL4_9CYAN|nr:MULTISPECIES: hypothetical protein [Oscillatoriales]MBD2186146.1 hypothetical protein [Aerosakkonema funiforme FACHB-1375]MBD3558610.1 hypothetical protein [Planktothrix sp. FACHB-1355]